MVQNLIIFREREREKKEQSMSTEVTALASTIGGPAPSAPKLTAERQQADTNMDTAEKCNGKMADEAEAQQAESLGPATEDANKA